MTSQSDFEKLMNLRLMEAKLLLSQKDWDGIELDQSQSHTQTFAGCAPPVSYPYSVNAYTQR